jgi:ATP-binding cassette, subfamily B, bacterial
MPSARSSRAKYEAWAAEKPLPPGETSRAGTPRRPRTRTFSELLRRYWRLLEGHRRTLALSLATLSIATGLGLLPPYATKLVFDHVLADAPPSEKLPLLPSADRQTLLYLICAVVFVATIVGVAFSMWGRWQCTRLVKRVQVQVRRRVFDHAARLPLHRIQSIKSGGASSMLREDAGSVGDLIFSLIYNPWRAVVQLSGTLIILAFIDWTMLLASLLFLPIVWFSHRTWIGRIRPMYRDIRATRQGLDSQAAEVFGGMRVVRGFAREPAENARFTSRGHLMARQEIRAWWWARSLEILWQVIVPLATIAVLLVFGQAVLQGERTTGDLIAFLLYLGWLLGPLESLVSSAANVQNQLAGLDRVIDLLSEPREYEQSAAGRTVSPAETEGRITLEAVSFAYPAGPRASSGKSRRWRLGDSGSPESESSNEQSGDGQPELVLADVNLEIEPGETIALVGPSGSGKTTLCNLIARFYDPSVGVIRLDGTDLRDIDPASYRRLLGVVEQDVFLFDGTIAENIAYARRHATREDILAAAEAASAHRFITETPDGYDTLIGERGVRLSGGQKQRLAIARAILADPRILILDEATSNLDAESEQLIQASLARLMRGRTSFVIAHRLSTIRHADRIVVLDHGQVTEIGPHEELMSREGRYAELVRLQTEPASQDPATAP